MSSRTTAPGRIRTASLIVLIGAIAAITWLIAAQYYRQDASTATISIVLPDDTAGEMIAPWHEPLGDNQMRVIALGTGMPYASHTDYSSSWLVQLGSGELFIFDMGSGSAMSFNALGIPHSEITGFFLTHLHADHIGDFVPFWITGWTSGRYRPMQIWGPSGPTAELGTRHFVEHQLTSMQWDRRGRLSVFPIAGADADVYEFDFARVQTVYDQHGVRIVSFPQPHSQDGSVGYRLDWQGLSFAYGGDAAPNRWFVEEARGADIVVHEAVVVGGPGGANRGSAGLDMEKLAQRFLYLHTQPRAVGRVFALTEPRLGVVTHFINTPANQSLMAEKVRETYNGRFVLARDLMTIDVTPDEIRVRQAAHIAHPEPPGLNAEHAAAAAAAERLPQGPIVSEWLQRGLLDLGEDNFPDRGGLAGEIMKRALMRAAEDLPPGTRPEELFEEPDPAQ